MNIEAIKSQLPPEWGAECYPHGRDLFVVERPQSIGGGFVTIDFGRRIFNTGIGQPRAPIGSHKTYSGRGWQRKIIANAVEHLNAMMA